MRVPDEDSDFDAALAAFRAREPGAEERLLPLVYEELRGIAGRHFRDQPAGHTLQPTVLVHDAFLRLTSSRNRDWNDRAHLLAVAARAMRQVLVSHARERGAQKRAGNRTRLTLQPGTVLEGEVDVLQLEDLLERLASLSERQARIVELRVFGGLTIEETAQALDVGVTTVKDDWHFARAWLAREWQA